MDARITSIGGCDQKPRANQVVKDNSTGHAVDTAKTFDLFRCEAHARHLDI